MKYKLIKDILVLVEQFEEGNNTKSNSSVEDFINWIVVNNTTTGNKVEPDWLGKDKGRSPESVINTMFVHMNRYAKTYSKSAIWGSDFSTQDDFIFLINLKAFGEMTKMELIKKNVQEKPAGMQIINRLIAQNWVAQKDSSVDKRSKVISITKEGLEALENQMEKIRLATQIVSGDLTHSEKMELIRLLFKLNDFHHKIYERNIEPEILLTEAYEYINN